MAPGVISRQEIVDKLDRIPVFSVNDAAERMVPIRVDGEDCCTWFADIAEAKALLAELSAQHPSARLHIGVTPLGTAYALAEGWVVPAGASEDEGEGAPKRPPLRLQPARATLATTEVERVPKCNPRTGPFPLFMSQGLQNAEVFPVFLSRADFAVTWAANGLSAAELPAIHVSELNLLIEKWQTDPTQDWSAMQPMPSPSAVDYVRQTQTEEVKDILVQCDPLDEPPPLEPDSGGAPPAAAASADAPAAEAPAPAPASAPAAEGKTPKKTPSARRPPLPPSPAPQ